MTTVAFDETIASACKAVPGVQKAALVLLPEAVIIGGAGAATEGAAGAARTTAVRGAGAAGLGGGPGGSKFIEYAFVSDEELVVIRRGHQHPQLALVLACSRESNLAFVMSETRTAVRTLEAGLDLTAWKE